jgi:hypothetical protein
MARHALVGEGVPLCATVIALCNYVRRIEVTPEHVVYSWKGAMTMPSREEQGHPPGEPPSRGGPERGRGVGAFFLAATLGLALGVSLGNAIGMRLTRGPIAMISLGGGFAFAVAAWGAAAGALIGGTGGALVWGSYRRTKER